MGVGAVKRLSAINFGVVKDMVLTWVFTFPGCGLISFVMAKLFMAAVLRGSHSPEAIPGKGARIMAKKQDSFLF